MIAGLGNPGAKYERTRHNAGFMVLEELERRIAAGDGGQDELEFFAAGRLSWREKFNAAIAESSIGGERVLLVRPLSFMNLSGEPVASVLGFWGIAPGELVVVHDDIDLPLGSLRIKAGGGDGGHNGVRSIVQHLGTSDFARLRLGIGRPGAPPCLSDGQQSADGGESATQSTAADLTEVSDWVLGRFAPEECSVMESSLERAVRALGDMCVCGVAKAQMKYN